MGRLRSAQLLWPLILWPTMVSTLKVATTKPAASKVMGVALTELEFNGTGGSQGMMQGYPMPDPMTEKDCEACDTALLWINNKREVCESIIANVHKGVSARIAKMKADLGGVDNQMKKLQPGTENLTKSLEDMYEKEADAYKDLHKATTVTTALLHRRATHNHSTSHRSAGDPSEHTVSSTNAEDIKRHRANSRADLVERWLQCADDGAAAQIQLAGCKVKQKSVQMWAAQREKMYQDKTDVYIMRVSRQADPVSAQFGEAARVGATIARIEGQVSAVKDISM